MESYNNLKLLTVKINRAGIALLLTSVFLIYSDLWHSPSTSAETEEKSILFQNLTISLKIPKDEELSPAEILRKVDDNMLYSTAKAEVEMIISFGKREFKKRMVSFSKGRDTSFVKFLYPSRDAGIKFLKMKDNMWMYLPSVDKIIRISGHMKRQSMMGSDFSYEDVMETSSLLEDYQVVLERKEKLKGNENYVLSLMAKRHNVTYVRRKLWVDAEKFIVNKMEL
ncbi:MAG: outer membrane lipoprotein-sorting protein, partial [Fidelibacterota bacterium]